MLHESAAVQETSGLLSPELLSPSEALINRFVAAWNRAAVDDVVALLAPSMVHHTRYADYRLEGTKLCYTILLTVFPDLHFEISDVLVKGDVVVTRLAARATHTGELLGTVPTGKQVSWETVNIARLEDDKIVEQWWNILDEPQLLDELGIVSPLIAC